MKAFVKDDIILSISTKGNVEIGDIPKGVALDRLRYDPFRGVVVDLKDLTGFWILWKYGVFELHAINISNSQYIEMAYEDRSRLTINNGVIRIKTQQEIDSEKEAERKNRIRLQLYRKLKSDVGSIEQQHMNTLAFVCALIVYARQQPQALADFFDEIIPVIQDIFPRTKTEQVLKSAAQSLKLAMEEYWQNYEANRY